MGEFVSFIADCLQEITNLLGAVNFSFDFNGVPTVVSLWGIFVGLIVVSIVISLFWKGGRG